MIILDFMLSGEIDILLGMMDFYWKLSEDGGISENDYHKNLDELLGELSLEIGYPTESNYIWN